MPNKLPKFLDNHKICMICEGNEEYEYLNRLKIPARYQDRYQNGADELVLVFCDTEKKPHEQYEDIKRKINEFHGVDSAANEVIIFGNPCTMQIISKHWTDENLKSPAKPVNAPLIKEYTGGGELQRKSRPDSESYGTCYCEELQRYEPTSERFGFG